MSSIKTSVFHEAFSVSHWFWAELGAGLDLTPPWLYFLSASLAKVPSLVPTPVYVRQMQSSLALFSVLSFLSFSSLLTATKGIFGDILSFT
jgi:hypothetical protein